MTDTPTELDQRVNTPRPTRADARIRQRIARQLAAIDYALPGSIVERMMRCGNQRCRCRADPPQLHGPYLQWTRKIDGKTVTRMLNPEQLDRYQTWLDNAQRLRELVHELEALTTRTIERAEGWGS
ncbi:MAG: DUF6788 family protein [Pseudonocardiaceae bacterium]